MDVMMYILGDKYMIPDLQEKAGQSFREKVDYLCYEWDGCDYKIRDLNDLWNAVQIIYDDLSDDDWPRWYIVQGIFDARAKFLAKDEFRKTLRDNKAFNDDIFSELAYDSKVWKWRKSEKEWHKEIERTSGFPTCKCLKPLLKKAKGSL